MSLKCQMTPRIFQNFTLQLQQCRLNIEKIEGRKRKLSPVRHQTCIVPSGNPELSSELLRFVRGVCPNFRQNSNFLAHHLGGMKLHQPRYHVFLIFFLFFGIKMPCHSMLNCVIVVRPICLKIPCNLLHMELNRTRVHEICVFKPLWLAVACTSSSNLNYGH